MPEFPAPITVDRENNRVFILDIELPFNPEGGPNVPDLEKFRYFCLDRRTLESIEKWAQAVALSEPCLQEGETSTSKTSAAEFLAAVTNHEFTRFNLNGQTDTSEMVGKFVPNDGQLQIKFEEMLRHPELLTSESAEILKRASSRGKGLSLLESQKIAQLENIKIPDWRWQDGLDIQAKKKGQWLMIDEINLAEPQILERLNSQLEKNPSIILSENDGLVIRGLSGAEMEDYEAGKLPNTEPLSPRFRIQATMNPAEYSGRFPMSPAYKDRWTSQKYVLPPHESDYFAMAKLMVYGQQPVVVIRGKKYQAPDVDPLFKKLNKIPSFEGFLKKIAKFQITVERMARDREIGKSKKEKYIFTRRGLIGFLEYLEKKVVVDRETGQKLDVTKDPKGIILMALRYYYLDKIATPDDLKKVTDQLDAIGISETKWTHVFS